MDKSKMIAELESNCKANAGQLSQLFKTYDLAVLGYDMQEERRKGCYNEALNAGSFYAAEGCDRCGIKAGDRITEEDCAFLLSDDDYDRYLYSTLPILEREGITDAEGKYLTDWLGIKCDARRALVGFIITKILPAEMKCQFEQARMNITHAEKLIDVIRPIVQKAA